MAKYRPIYIKIWSDPDFAEYHVEGKLLFIYLCTNPLTSESGIYQLPLKTTSDYTKLSVERIEQLLTQGLKNVYYDIEHKYVFVRKFRRYNPGGNPDLMRKSILSDYNQSKYSYLWSIFLEEYPEFSDIILNPKPFTVNPKPFTVNPKPILEYHTIPIQDSVVIGKGKVLNSIETLPDNKIVSNKNKDFDYWSGELQNASNNGHKVGVLVDAFKFICNKAPKDDFVNLGGRLAGIVKHYGNEYGIVLRNMYVCPVYKPDGSWLNYIEKMPKGKYDNKLSYKDSVQGKDKSERIAPSLTRAKDVIARTKERKNE